MDRFVSYYSTNKYNEQYENSYATTSKLIYDFISWLKNQPYYKDTTIVIMGDHLCMQSSFITKRKSKDRYVYNLIINPSSKDAKTNNRIYTALDTLPTIISAVGGDIKGNKLGLGTNLFSNTSTLAEKYGINKLDNELKKSSKYYNSLK
jgi:phosphoglycerol transferase